MGLISGMVMGMLFGIALMAGWKYMMQYRGTKRVAKAVDIKLLSSLNREDMKKICGENLPEWISFPVFEQVKWLNKQLAKLWPFVADAAEAVIKESVEPLLEEYRPPGITSLKFSKLSLGTVAPKIEGIRVQSLKEGQITMDIDLRWGGDPSIILAVEAALVASIPIQLKDLKVFTVVRAIFQLADEIPCISAVVVALLAEPKPRIDYTLKAVGGSLTAIPGISDMIDDTVNTIVTDMLQWPHRIVVPIGGIPVDTSELELKPVGKLTVTVIRAKDLKNMELIGKSDPYVVVHIRPLFKVKTKVIDNNLNPVWNQTFDLIAEDKETQSLILEVFDQDIGQDKRLGIAKLPLIEVLYHEFNKEEQLAALEEEKRILEERKKLKEAGVIGSTMDALDGAASLVGSGVGMVGTGIGAGVGLVGTGLGAGVGIVGSGLGAVGSGLSKAGKFMGRTITGHSSSSKRSGSSTPVNPQENGGAKPLGETGIYNGDCFFSTGLEKDMFFVLYSNSVL
ncbi:Synaptotagmin-5 [Sesamum angolense]|uniref:Synaptotagmin-5 n=1 Tax=Sesamum angolense TaxID=2727404 RepID=A0AAE1XH28_9LAMI|nr:Synaptotagmin-5 [Sesamum angolense]